MIQMKCDQELPRQDHRGRLQRREPEGFSGRSGQGSARKLRYLNAAADLGDLRSPPGNRVEALAGDRQGQHSIRINKQWRLCFVFGKDGAEDVEISKHYE